jgi:hypothetical protein
MRPGPIAPQAVEKEKPTALRIAGQWVMVIFRIS